MARRLRFAMRISNPALIIPALVVVFAAAVIWAALQLELSPPMIVGDAMQPRVFPILLMVLGLMLAGLLTVQLIRHPEALPAREGLRTWGSAGLFGVFYVLTTYVDLFVAITLVMFAMSLLWGERRIHLAGGLAIIVPFLIFLLFDQVLRVRFPRGLITNWYYG